MSIRLQLTKQEVLQILQAGLETFALTQMPKPQHDEFLVRLKTYNWNVDEHKIRAEVESELNALLKQNQDELSALKDNPVRFKVADALSLGMGRLVRNSLHQGKIDYTENNIRKFSSGKTRNKIASSMFDEKVKSVTDELAKGKVYITQYVEIENKRNRVLMAIARLEKLEFNDILFTDSTLASVLFAIESVAIKEL